MTIPAAFVLTGEDVRTLSSLFICVCLCAGGALAIGPRTAAAAAVTDDAGARVELSAPAERIVPLYAGLGEILVALGAREQVAGRTASDDSLPASLPVVGTHMRPDFERIAALSPDLVIQFEGREEAGLTARRLQDMGIAVARFRIASFADLFACVERLGTLCGREEEAGNLVASMRARLERARALNAAFRDRPAVFFEVRYPNLLGAGGGSLVDDVIRHAGGANCLAAHPERMVRLSEEALALHAPAIYLLQEGAMNRNPVPVEQRPHFRNLPAVKRGFVKKVAESLYSRPGPHSVEAVEELARYIHLWHVSAKPHEGGRTVSHPERPAPAD